MISDDFGRWRTFDQASIVQQHRAPGIVSYVGYIVRDQQYGEALFVERLGKFHNLATVTMILPSGWLVQLHDLWLHSYNRGNTHFLFVSPCQEAGECRAYLVKAKKGDGFIRPFLHFFFR